MKFNSNKLGLSLAGALSAAYTAVVLICIFMPGLAEHMEHGLVHYHGAMAMSLNEYICGLLRTAVYSYLIGAFFAITYNHLNK